MIVWPFTMLGCCRHPQTYRERRELHGVPVLHFVCEDCGHAVPVLNRTPEEHQATVAAGAPTPPAIQRVRHGVLLPMHERRPYRR